MRVIVDLVLNHTSSQHPWFIEANSNPQSRYRNWYVWSDTDPATLASGKWRLLFRPVLRLHARPELSQPEVTAEMEKMARFWLNDIGIDGFRVAAKQLMRKMGKPRTPRTHEWLKASTALIKPTNQCICRGEVFGAGGLIAKTYTGIG